MLETLINLKLKESYPIPNGPGPQIAIAGHASAGFFGEVSSSEFINGDALASAINLTAGISQNSSVTWLKFYLNGKILFTPKKPFRHSLSWRNIYNAGAVHGSDDNGPYPISNLVNQNAKVSIDNDIFKVRLFRGASSFDASTSSSGYDAKTSHGSEWNQLMYNVFVEKPASQVGENWLSLTTSDLGQNATSTICQELLSGLNSCVLRGYISQYPQYSIAHFYWGGSDGNNTVFSWRPVLELEL